MFLNRRVFVMNVVPRTNDLLTLPRCYAREIKDIKGKRKVQGVPQSQAAILPRHQEEEQTDKTKQAQIGQTSKSTKISCLFPKRDNRNAKRTENARTK